MDPGPAFAVNGPVGGYGGGLTASVMITCIVAASGGLIYGYDIGISGGVTTMVPFLEKFFPTILLKGMDAKTSLYCRYNSQTLTTFTSSLYIAGLASSLIASRLTATFGRRNIMLLGGCLFLAGGVINGGAENILMLILGRILLGFGVGFTNQVTVASVLAAVTGVSGTNHISKGYGILVLFQMCLYVAGFGCSWGTLTWLIPSEIFPMKIRTTGQSISIAINFATAFILSQTFLTMLCRFTFATFLFYAGWIFVMTIFIMFFLPETKGIPLNSMYEVWERHWYWSRFVKAQSPSVHMP